MIKKRVFVTLLSFILTLTVTGYAQKQSATPDHNLSYYEDNARNLIRKNDNASARKLLEEGLRNNPASASLNYLMGQTFFNVRDYDKARYYLYKSVRYNPDNLTGKSLLVRTEELTGNYSSAICYINEMLRYTPYNKGLWLRKINLYKKQGNTIQADHLLRRLAQIYPNDKSIQRRLSGRIEENVIESRKKGDNRQAIADLQDLIHRDPHDGENYLLLSNLLLQSGRQDEALAITTEGLRQRPGYVPLAEKHVGILAAQHRYNEANEFIATYTRKHPNARLTTLQQEMEEAAADDALRNDAYVMYGRIYERKKSPDALNYLINTAVARGYTNDALYYIKEARKKQGNTPSLLYKEYEVYKSAGDKRHALPVLQKLFALQPANHEVAEELCMYHMDQAVDLIVTKDYSEAIPLLEFIMQHASENDTRLSAMNKMYTCLFETRQYSKASTLLDRIYRDYPSTGHTYMKKADLLKAEGKPAEALVTLREALNRNPSADMRQLYITAYEDIALPYIKDLLDGGAVPRAYNVAKELLEILPSSRYGLLYAINSAGLLRKYAMFDEYTRMAVDFYPDDVTFQKKMSASLNRRHRYTEAVNQLRPWLDIYTNDSSLIKAHSAASSLLADSLIKQHQGHRAISVLDSALVFDAENRELLYAKGVAFESIHEYDSAYSYEKNFRPSLLEAKSFALHLEKLRMHGNNNTLDVEYRQARYGDQDVRSSVASLSYTRKTSHNSYTARINYAGRDGSDLAEEGEIHLPGGTGLQFVGEWEHTFSERWSATVNAAWASTYFPNYMANIQLQRTLKHDWLAEIHAGYRRVETYQRSYILKGDSVYGYAWSVDKWNKQLENMFNAGFGITKTWEQFDLGGKIDLISYANKLCYNVGIHGSYTPPSSRLLKLTASTGVGNAPETEIVDAALPGAFNKKNTMVSFGGKYLLLPTATLSVIGTWNTFASSKTIRTGNDKFYTDQVVFNYKNLFSIDATLSISF